jgi:hypothetical protein
MSTFYENMRGAQKEAQEEARVNEENKNNFNSRLENLYTAYTRGMKQNGAKSADILDRQAFADRMDTMIGEIGAKDNRWSLDDYKAGRVSDEDRYEYGNELFGSIYSGMDLDRQGEYDRKTIDMDLDKEEYDRIRKNDNTTVFDQITSTDDMTDEEKAAYNRLKSNWYDSRRSDRGPRSNKRHTDDTNLGESFLSGVVDVADWVGSGAKNQWNSPYYSRNDAQSFQTDYNTLVNYANKRDADFADVFSNFEQYIADYKPDNVDRDSTETTPSKGATPETVTTGGGTSGGGEGTPTATPNETTDVSSPETFNFQVNPGDNYNGFGSMLAQLGEVSEFGLWGEDGDVAFYRDQLEDQGALDENGNIRIGQFISLRRRQPGQHVGEPFKN